MTQDFKTRAELYAYTERRVMINIDKYARKLMNMGDIFPPDPYGVYNAVTGECIADFGKAPYSLEEGKKVSLRDWGDFDNAKGDIYDHHGYMTLAKRNLKRVTLADERPVFCKAKEAAAAYYAKILHENEEYSIIAKNIKDFEDCVYMDSITESTRRFSDLKSLEEEIFRDNHDMLGDDRFKEKLFHCKAGIYMIDVMLDIRVKDYYERQFDKRDRESDDEREGSYNGRHIRCS